jgi:carboxyl-terminal processing protease
VEWVSPRGQHFLKPMVVLVGPWTGSMGEGLAIGLNAARGAPVLGQPMARLLGALDQTTLAHSGIVVRVPAEKLSHIDGTPREDFVPCSLQGALPRKPAADGAQDGAQGDAELRAAIAWARSPRSGVRHCPTPHRRAALPASR